MQSTGQATQSGHVPDASISSYDLLCKQRDQLLVHLSRKLLMSLTQVQHIARSGSRRHLRLLLGDDGDGGASGRRAHQTLRQVADVALQCQPAPTLSEAPSQTCQQAAARSSARRNGRDTRCLREQMPGNTLIRAQPSGVEASEHAAQTLHLAAAGLSEAQHEDSVRAREIEVYN